MPEPPSAGEIFRRMNEAKARAADAERRAKELEDAAYRKAKEARIATPLPGTPVEPDPGLMEQADAARGEGWEATAEAIRLEEELGNAPTDEDILGETEFVDPTIGPTTAQERAEAAGTATWLYRALRDPTTWRRLAGAGLGALGLLLVVQGLNAQTPRVPGGASASAPVTAAPTASPPQRVTAPISAAPIVVKPIVAVAGPTTEYVVAIEQLPPQEGPTFSWSGATCGTGTATGNRYSWNHGEQVVAIIGGLGNRELGRSGNCDHKADPSHGNPLIVAEITSRSFAARCSFRGAGSGIGAPCEVTAMGAATAAPTPTAAPATVAAAPAAIPGTLAVAVAVADGGGPNFALSALGFFLLVVAIALWFGGPRLAGGPLIPQQQPAEDGLGLGGKKYLDGLASGKSSGLRFAIPYPGGRGVAQVKEEARPEPCAEEKRQEAKVRRRLDAARQRLEPLERLRADAERSRAEADRAAREAEAEKDDRPGASWVDEETGQRNYTNADERGRRAKATEALSRAAAQTADLAKAAYDAAGGAAVHESARAELRTAEAQWREADAALKACLGQSRGRG